MANVSADDLASLAEAFPVKAVKPKLKGVNSLNEAQRRVNFGIPQTAISAKEEPIKIKIRLASPTIKKNIPAPILSDKKINQEADIDKIASTGAFSASAISFIPYGVGFLNAFEALKQIKNNYKIFYSLQQNYLSEANLEFILTKINKIYDLSDKDRDNLRHFYHSLLISKQTAHKKRTSVKTYLDKIKSKAFRTKISEEIQRMMQPDGDLYKYYSAFSLIDESIKKQFLHRIAEIDFYIIKKIKEIINFTVTDIEFCFDEVLEFVSVIETRNILMDNFHEQVEQLASQKKLTDQMSKEIENTIASLEEIAKNYGKLGKYGRQINLSGSLLNQLKKKYFQSISGFISPNVAKAQETMLNLDTGNYNTLEDIKNAIGSIDIKKINKQCEEMFTNIKGKEIK